MQVANVPCEESSQASSQASSKANEEAVACCIAVLKSSFKDFLIVLERTLETEETRIAEEHNRLHAKQRETEALSNCVAEQFRNWTAATERMEGMMSSLQSHREGLSEERIGLAQERQGLEEAANHAHTVLAESAMAAVGCNDGPPMKQHSSLLLPSSAYSVNSDLDGLEDDTCGVRGALRHTQEDVSEQHATLLTQGSFMSAPEPSASSDSLAADVFEGRKDARHVHAPSQSVFRNNAALNFPKDEPDTVIPDIRDALADLTLSRPVSTSGAAALALKSTLPMQKWNSMDGGGNAGGRISIHSQLDDPACTGLINEPSVLGLQQKSLMDLQQKEQKARDTVYVGFQPCKVCRFMPCTCMQKNTPRLEAPLYSARFDTPQPSARFGGKVHSLPGGPLVATNSKDEEEIVPVLHEDV